MGIIDQNVDPSSKRIIFKAGSGAIATGVTGIVEFVQWPCSLDFASVAAFGVSGVFNVQLYVNRFIIGSGFTAFAVSATLVPPAFGTSGYAASGISLVAIGSTLTSLLAGDVIMYQTGGANSAATGFNIDVALRPLQDIRKVLGVI